MTITLHTSTDSDTTTTSTTGLCLTGPSSTSTENIDEVYYWDSVRFSVEGCIFQVPQYHFIQGSEYFHTKYLLPSVSSASSADSGNLDNAPSTRTSPIIIEDGVTAAQFRTLLKVLFPIHTTTTTTTLTPPEWHTVLTLSTLWHFHTLRHLSIYHLESPSSHPPHPHSPPLSPVPSPTFWQDPIALIKTGRAAFVERWVLRGYEMLVLRRNNLGIQGGVGSGGDAEEVQEGTISEQECKEIGYLTGVRLYIIRDALLLAHGRNSVGLGVVEGNGGRKVTGEDAVKEMLKAKFRDDLEEIRVQESARRTRDDIEKEARVVREREEAERQRQQQQQEEDEKKKINATANERKALEEQRLRDEKIQAEVLANLAAQKKLKEKQELEEQHKKAIEEFDRFVKEQEEEKRRLEEQQQEKRREKLRRRQAKKVEENERRMQAILTANGQPTVSTEGQGARGT